MNKLKTFLSKLWTDIKTFDAKNPGEVLIALAFLSVPFIMFEVGHKMATPKTDIRASSVMITTREMNHGGTGIILASTRGRSSILTNDHVCRAIKDGGVVVAKTGVYQVASLIESELSDLCLVQVLADLHTTTTLSSSGPEEYDAATISGHPALMPNVLTSGHVSGRKIIEVMTGIRPCTEAELSGPLGIVCFFFNGMPVVKSFESVLVTATIMPGSSGSGVYNTDKELIGVVFAGQGDLGYAWTVPYEQVVNFIFNEHRHLKVQNLNQELSLVKKDDSTQKYRELIQKCEETKDETIMKYCSLLKRDVVWRE